MLIVTKQTSLLWCLIFFMETFIRGNSTNWSPARPPRQAFGEVPFPFHWTQPPAPPIIPATVQMFKIRKNISDISKRRWNIWDILCNTLTVQKKTKLKHSTSVNCLIETLWFWLWSNFLKISSMFFFAWFFLRFRFTAMKAIWNYYCIQYIIQLVTFKLIYGTDKKIMNILSLSVIYVNHGMVRFTGPTYKLCMFLENQKALTSNWNPCGLSGSRNGPQNRGSLHFFYSIPPPQVQVQPEPEVQVQFHVDAQVEYHLDPEVKYKRTHKINYK